MMENPMERESWKLKNIQLTQRRKETGHTRQRKRARRKPAPDGVSQRVKRADQHSRENAEAVPLDTKSKTQLEAIFKRPSKYKDMEE